MNESNSATFKAESRAVIRRGQEALDRLDRDQNWYDWLQVGEAVVECRKLALFEANTEQPQGPKYREAIARLLKQSGFEEERLGKQDRNALVEIMEKRLEIEAWREQLGVHERRRYNHPRTVLAKFREATRPKPQPKPAAQARAHVASPDPRLQTADIAKQMTTTDEKVRLRQLISVVEREVPTNTSADEAQARAARPRSILFRLVGEMEEGMGLVPHRTILSRLLCDLERELLDEGCAKENAIDYGNEARQLFVHVLTLAKPPRDLKQQIKDWIDRYDELIDEIYPPDEPEPEPETDQAPETSQDGRG